MGPAPQPLEQRFWRFVSPEPNSGCWLWDGAAIGVKERNNIYGALKSRGRMLRASHLSLAIHGRPKPHPKAYACHHCDNGMCVNPDHLYWGDNSTNQKDAYRRNRRPIAGPHIVRQRARTHCKRGHEFTLENTRVDNRGFRSCRECGRNLTREWQKRRDGMEA
jgi:hypothetical protein